MSNSQINWKRYLISKESRTFLHFFSNKSVSLPSMLFLFLFLVTGYVGCAIFPTDDIENSLTRRRIQLPGSKKHLLKSWQDNFFFKEKWYKNKRT